MTTPSRLPNPDQEALPSELIDLAKAIAKLPEAEQQSIEPAFVRVVDAVKRRRRILALVQEALAQLRLDIKYLMFDLDMTRRERDELAHPGD
ncbi:transcriptional regulator [Calycomorphotria hydatis]|uniref:Uncharacterized protein n=1 Tax=Calycomorphotria hydatis TaxID=2528027 RepID=A0A517T481_9PLAN|nr:transcriptional regulator [Calycomorphotria hydatis]QDT63170.1 hypothetical protein V22_03880 [Calycomorphotria hydatis]